MPNHAKPFSLREEIERLFDSPPERYTDAHSRVFQQFKDALNAGTARAAEADLASHPAGWRVNTWVKKGILLGFRVGALVPMLREPPDERPSADVSRSGRQPFFDKSTYPLKRLALTDGVRIVPGGSSIRDGCYVAPGVTCMPPMFINVGAHVGEGTMVDSHALVGSCAQVGRNCHISAGAQLGGVLEPIGELPVIIEDEVLVGGNCGVYEGTVVKRRAVLATGVLLNRSTPVYDLVREQVYTATADTPLVIPAEAVVLPGARAVSHPLGKQWGLSLYAAVIVKYRDAATDARLQLEDLLR